MAGRKRVLFVDDEPSLRVTLPQILERHGFEVTAAASVAEAIALISRTEFDILVSDLNIGEPGDGFTVVSAMRRIQPQARSFILTGYPDFESALRAIRKQVDDYFVKPADLDQLVAMLERKIIEPKQMPYGPLKRVSQIFEELEPSITRQFIESVSSSPEFRSIRLSRDDIGAHVPTVIAELVRRVRTGAAETTAEAFAEVAGYGVRRHEQAFSVAMLVKECHLLEHVISTILQDNLLRTEMSTLIRDMIAVGETLNAFTEGAVRAFSQAALPHTA